MHLLQLTNHRYVLHSNNFKYNVGNVLLTVVKQATSYYHSYLLAMYIYTSCQRCFLIEHIYCA
jgi:hypothetical protein